ncbi:MAG: SDR family oxidoreductase [Muribaculaceae bacterium]|nr:SDR family oxidoreductase [Muribaculaceae bacterium]
MTDSPFSLEGKTVLITGASSGIGRASAVECSLAGASCCILVARDFSRLSETASLMDSRTEVISFSTDLTDNEAVEAMVKELPKLDAVLLNAGINKMQLVPFYSEAEIGRIFSVNCFSPMLLMKLLVKKKKLNKPSSVVFMASISGHTNVSHGNGVYGASKAALSAYMKYAALELAPKGIRCNAIHPGRVETALISGSPLDEEAVKADKEKYPMKRYADPREIAWSVVYLFSDAAAWITGSDLIIDGGRSLT